MHIHRPGVWAWARVERDGPSIARVRIWRIDGSTDEEVPPSVLILATVIKPLHHVLGGGVDPDRLKSEAERVHCKAPVTLSGVLGGVVESTEVWPFVASPEAARDVWKDAWPLVGAELRKLGGMLGRVEEGETQLGDRFFEFTYGQQEALGNVVAQLAVEARMPAPRGRIVDLGPVKMRMSGRLLPGMKSVKSNGEERA